MAEEKQIKAGSVLQDGSIWPTPIVKCYNDLFHLMKEGNVYGSLLQIKDLYETVLKMPVLAALIYICGTNKEILLKDADLLEKWVSKALSLGNWDALAVAILNKNKKGQYTLPKVLVDGIKMTRKLVSMKISPQYPNVLNWRNDVIGHGALQFEDSEEYQTAIRGMLNNIRDYFEGRGKDFRGSENLYEKIVFFSNDVALRGDNVAINPDNKGLSLMIDGETVDVGAFVKMNSFLFSSFYYNKRTIKYLDYESGKDLIKDDFELYEYVSAYQNAEKYRDKRVSAAVLRREEEKMFSLLSQAGKYIPPDSLFHRIRHFMDENDRGIIMMCMERGTGKSAFANRIDNLYHDPDTALIEDTVIRSYSLGLAELRGINDFINAVNVIFTRSYNANNDLRFSENIKPEIKNYDNTPAEAMASVLNTYQEIYADEFGIYNLMLVLDGVDEATADTGIILDYLPTSNLLNEGVYIVCTSRFEDEETVPYTAREHIRDLITKSDCCIEIRRKESENQQVLAHYIKQEVPDASKEFIQTLIEKAEYRMLYLKVHLALTKGGMRCAYEGNIASGYIMQLQKKYNGRSFETLRKTAAMLCILGPITINDYFEYISKEEPTYGFIGSLNDLLPLLTVRGSDYGREYMLANESYYAAFADEFHNEIVSLIDNIKTNFSRRFFPDENDPYDSCSSRRSNLSYVVNLSYEERTRLERENYYKEQVFWILTVGRVLSFCTKHGFDEILLTEDFVNPFLLFSDMFITNHQHHNGYIDNIRSEALKTVLNMLLFLARRSNLTFVFLDGLAVGSFFTRELYYIEGYDDLIQSVFNENTTVEQIRSWKNIFFAQDTFGPSADWYSGDEKIIDEIRKANLLGTLLELFSDDYGVGYGYLPYLLYIHSLELDDILMEKTMNLIVWSYLQDDFCCDYKEAKGWLNQIKARGYKVIFPNNKSVKERIISCLNDKEKDISEEMENLFWGFRLINADLTDVDYKEIDNVLNSSDSKVREAAVWELKKCFDVVNNIFDAGILPDDIWSEERRSQFFYEWENSNLNDDSESEEWAAQDQYTILKNCLPLFKYVRLVYESKTSDVIERWMRCIDNCIEKHSDLESYHQLYRVVDMLYWMLDHLDETNNEKRMEYLSRYVARYNTGSCLLNLHLLVDYYDSEFRSMLLPSDAAITLLMLYHNEGLHEEAIELCEKLSDGVETFNNKILETLPDSDIPLPLDYYLTMYQYVKTCRELGYDRALERISFDFKREMSALKKVVSTCNKYSDLWWVQRIVGTVLSFYKEVGADSSLNYNVLTEMIAILKDRIKLADEETAKELDSMAVHIEETRKEIYG